MKKRIYLNIILLLVLCSVLLSTSISCVFYDVTKSQEIVSIKDRSLFVVKLLNRSTSEKSVDKELYYNLFTDFNNIQHETTRMTIIAPNGAVIFDNKTSADTLENHSNREEFEQAMTSGVGESTRYSTTFDSMTYYYAVKLSDGNVLRLSKTIKSVIGIFTSVLPVVVIITVSTLLFANLIARRLTNNIIKPINEINFEVDNILVYDELSPFIKKIEQQKSEISNQLLVLKNRAETIKSITENMKEGLILVDRNGNILSANISALGIFDRSDVIDKNILHICRDMDLLQNMKLCLSGVNSEMLFTLAERTYNIYFNPTYHGNEINGAVILFLETTEKYKAEKQRREFSANVSHELKTPLTTISALSEMIENGMAKKEDVKDFAYKISNQTKRLINIIDDIIRLSEFDEGNINTGFLNFNLLDLANTTINSLQDKADERHVILELYGEPFNITANRRMIDELLYNLIDNGIKYNKDSGRVSVTLSKEDDFCKISVCDTGIGILKGDLNRVFERFYRVDKSRSQKTGGTGLGLSIVKHIAEYHKGRVEIESVENVGTTIVCYIKL